MLALPFQLWRMTLLSTRDARTCRRRCDDVLPGMMSVRFLPPVTFFEFEEDALVGRCRSQYWCEVMSTSARLVGS